MHIRTWLIVGALWIVSVFAVGSFTHAQVPFPPRAGEPQVITGPDLGFVVAHEKGGIVFGQLAVRIDGKWRRVAPAGGNTVPLAE